MRTPPERWKLLEPLIDTVAELPRDRWPAFLDDTCRDDPGLRAELEILLLEYDRNDTLLDHPAAERFASLLGEVATPPPDLVNGNYRIERKVGQGGMATVYLAHDLRHDRNVALKILHPELTAAFRAERFLTEIRTMAQLHHPHILPLHDSGKADGVLYYVMPYVEGETLRQRIDREKQLEVGEAVRIVREVAAALDSAHRRGVVHRDIKPENILLDEGGALVADFGIALAVSAQAGWVAGTPRYMSPEQAAGGAIDGRADVYSLGAVAYEMLAGRPPFLAGRGTAPPPPVRDFRPAIPPRVDAVLARALAPAAADRYRTAGELAEALGRALDARVSGGRGRRWSIPLAIAVAVAGGVFGVVRARPTKVDRPAAVTPRLTSNLGAYDLYVRGKDQALSRGYERMATAIQYFRQAIAADSNFAAAYAELAQMYTLVGAGTSLPDLPREEAVRLAPELALKAVALDSNLADSWAALAFVRMQTSYDIRSAEVAVKRALALDPSSSRVHAYLAGVHRWMERPEEALAEARRAKELDSLLPVRTLDLASALYCSGRLDEALAELDKLRDVDPPLARTTLYTGLIYLSKGMWEDAAGEMNAYVEGGPWYGRALARAGQRDSARRILAAAKAKSLEEGQDSYGVAILYDALGEEDEAFAWLEKAFDDHSLAGSIMFPEFDRLRADPRFERIRRRLRGDAPPGRLEG